MKKLGLSALALAGVVAFTGCSCVRNGEYTFDTVEVKEGEETKTYTCEKGEERSTAGNVACAAISAMPTKIVLDGDKVKFETTAFGTSVSKEYEAKVEKKKLYSKNPKGEWEEIGEFKGKKLIFGEEDFTVIYKK